MPASDASKTLVLSNQSLTTLSDDISPSLSKLDLSFNSFKQSSLSILEKLPLLTLLQLSHNQISNLPQLSHLPKLLVLNLSFNSLSQIPTQISSCNQLKALILNNNQLHSIQHLSKCVSLNTLVVSHNNLESISHIGTMKSLKKISAANNKISKYPHLFANTDLRELKLNNNLITSIPESIACTPKLEILDLGNNQITEFGDIIHLISLKRITQLNLKGNPICDKLNYREKIKTMIPSLRILDGKRFEERKRKIEVLEESNSIEIPEESLKKPKLLSLESKPNQKHKESTPDKTKDTIEPLKKEIKKIKQDIVPEKKIGGASGVLQVINHKKSNIPIDNSNITSLLEQEWTADVKAWD